MDEVTARDSSKKFDAHADGQFSSVIVDVVNLGQRVETFPGSQPRINDKTAIVFRTDSDTEPREIAVEMTVSMHEKSRLRGFLEQARGKKYTEEQAREGVPLHKLVGHAFLISVERRTSAKGRQYATIVSIAPLPKKMNAPDPEGYVRAEYWAERKKQYADEARRWAEQMASTQDGPPLEESEAATDDLDF